MSFIRLRHSGINSAVNWPVMMKHPLSVSWKAASSQSHNFSRKENTCWCLANSCEPTRRVPSTFSDLSWLAIDWEWADWMIAWNLFSSLHSKHVASLWHRKLALQLRGCVSQGRVGSWAFYSQWWGRVIGSRRQNSSASDLLSLLGGESNKDPDDEFQASGRSGKPPT